MGAGLIKIKTNSAFKLSLSWGLALAELGNKTRWLERREAEKQKRLEIEKEERLQEAKNKKNKIFRKFQEEGKMKVKKETKQEYSGRLEEEKRLKGKQMMKSNLWKQRREQDGRLVNTWNVMRKQTESQNNSIQE